MTVGLTMIAVCALIRPAGLGANDGASYFGVFRTTIIPYAVGYFTCAALYWRRVGAKRRRIVKWRGQLEPGRRQFAG